MKPKQLSEYTTDELKKSEKGLRIAVIVLGVCVGLMFLSGGYLYSKNGFTFSTAMPLLFLPLWFLNYRNWKKMKTEVTKRR